MKIIKYCISLLLIVFLLVGCADTPELDNSPDADVDIPDADTQDVKLINTIYSDDDYLELYSDDTFIINDAITFNKNDYSKLYVNDNDDYIFIYYITRYKVNNVENYIMYNYDIYTIIIHDLYIRINDTYFYL